MNLLLTGASGFLGRNFLLAAPRDWQIDATWFRDGSFPAFVREQGLGHVRPLGVDLTDAVAVAEALQPTYDRCLFLASNVNIPWSVQNPAGDLDANARTVVNVLSAMRCERLVYLSSGAVYDGQRGIVPPDHVLTPRIPYAISKLAAELYIRHFELRRRSIGSSVIVRFFGAYGPYEPARKIYTRLIRALAVERSAQFEVIGDGKNLIDAMYIDDAIEGLMRCLLGDTPSITLDFASGHPLSIDDLVTTAARVLQTQVEIRHVGFTEEYIEFRADTDVMAHSFGFRPEIELDDGLIRLRDHLVR